MTLKQQRFAENSIAMAEDLDNLLEHIAWTDIVEPTLLSKREALVNLLVDTNLGRPATVPIKGSTAQRPLKAEEIAGQIYGIDYILSFFRKLLTNGETADKKLQDEGVKVTYTS